jgi:WD40 repeat protein
VASAGDNGQIRVYETGEGRLIDSLDIGSDVKLRTPNFSADNRTLFAVADQPTCGLIVWELGSAKPHQFVAMPGIVSASMASDGSQLALALAPANGIVLWDPIKQTTIRTLIDPPLKVTGLETSSNGLWLAGSVAENTVVLVDVATGACRELPGTGGPLNGLAFDHAGERLAVVTGWQLLQVFDVKSAMVIDAIQISITSHDFSSICFSPDGEVLAVASRGPNSRGGNVQMFHLGARRSVLTLKPFDFGATSVRFSNDGRILACATALPDNDGNAGVVLWRFDPPRNSSSLGSASMNSVPPRSYRR